MKIPKFVRNNLLLKITSLNAVVISIRLLISLVVQRVLAQWVGEAGIAKIGQLRNLSQMVNSVASLGTFNGIVKYVAEFKEDQKKLQQLFSTTFVFFVVGSLISFCILFFASETISNYLFVTPKYSYLIKIVALIVPVISVQRIFNGVIHGLSRYKKFAKIDLVGYVLATLLLLYFLFNYNIDGVLLAIALTPVLQLGVLLFVFLKELKTYLQFSGLTFKIPFAKSLLAFTLMSFFSTLLLNYVEIGVRSMLVRQISEADAGIWTAMTNISKNYMVFSGSIFSLYVLPKFAGIKTKKAFQKELGSIYKTLLPLFGAGMFLVYLFRHFIIQLIYPDFHGLGALFKWQLLGDFVRLASVVLAHQFLAKKMVRNFIFTEVLSLGLFFGLAFYLVPFYGLQGVVIAHFIRYVIYFGVVAFLVWRYFRYKRALNNK